MNNLKWLVFITLFPMAVSAHGGHGNTENSLIHAVLHSESLPITALALIAGLSAIGLIRIALQRKNRL